MICVMDFGLEEIDFGVGRGSGVVSGCGLFLEDIDCGDFI